MGYHVIKFRIFDEVRCQEIVSDMECEGINVDRIFDKYRNTHIAYGLTQEQYDKWFTKLAKEANFYKTF